MRSVLGEGVMIQALRMGPTEDHWHGKPPKGDCEWCDGQCDGDDCGLHAAGCIFGGPIHNGYWLIAAGCPLWHGEKTDGME